MSALDPLHGGRGSGQSPGRALLLGLALGWACGCGVPAEQAPADERAEFVGETEGVPPLPEPDVPFVPTPREVVDEMLRLAEVGPSDVVYDLGCGDGRIVIAAVADRGAELGVCVEIDPALVRTARTNARWAGVEDRIEFVEGDLFEVDLSPATVVTLYLLPSVNLELRPKLLRELRPGTRVVSHDFDMGSWRPEEVVEMEGHTVYFWRIPLQAARPGAPAAAAGDARAPERRRSRLSDGRPAAAGR